MVDALALAPFVPRLAVDLGGSGVPTWAHVEGSMLSADISGFTALSEKLAGKGKVGAEEITSLLNACFTALIDAAYAFGGEVLKFGGDALLVMFRGANHERRAADAALAMQGALRASSAARRAQLSMTVGVAEGPFDVFLVGSGYRELLVCGRRASEVIRLEGEAAKGDTLVSASIAARLPAPMRVRDEAGGVLVTGMTGDEPSGPVARVQPHDDLTPYVPRQVVEQLSAFSSLGGEHRLVTVGFVMLAGVAAQLEAVGPPRVAEQLGHVVDEVVAACDAFGVTALHTDIANDGVKFVLCAGAPLSPGDTTDAMLQAALRIAAMDTPFVLRQGVQAGRVFAGFLGSQYRRTYTLMGDPVNTAARMLGKAADRDIVAVATAVHDTRTVFVSDELEPFMVKGKSEPITAHRVRAVTGQVRRLASNLPLVGRDRELEVLRRVVQGNGEVVELAGLPGSGKTRLLEAAWEAAGRRRVHQAACTAYGAASPYSVFRPLLRSGMGIPVDVDADTAGARLTGLVDRAAPDLRPLLPLLAVPFGARVRPTAEADAIEAQFRRMRIHDVMVRFLDATITEPVLLVVEDTHWIDDASGELLNHLVRAAADRAWAIVITRRPEGAWAIADESHVARLAVGPLDDAAVHRLAIEVSTRPLPDRDLQTIAERSAGNPLFAIELTRALGDGGGELPDSVEQIIASRLDRLVPEARRLVRVASVVGVGFDPGLVGEVAGSLGSVGDPQRALAAAAGDGIVRRLPAGTWAFNHGLYRDAAYNGLPFGRRRELHRLVAEAIEARATDAGTVAPLLSLHYAAAGVHHQAWQHSLRAAAVALGQQATTEAAAALERALRAGRHVATAVERAEVAERLGDLYYDLARFADARVAYAQARRLGGDGFGDVRLVRKTGAVLERQGRPDLALRWYSRAARQVPVEAADAGWAVARAEIALAEAGIRARRGENERCLHLAEAALHDALQAGDERVQALALERMHLARAYLRRPDGDRAGPRALELHRALHDRSGTARTLVNMGIEAYFSSRWTQAREHYLEALEIAQRAGNVVLAATAALNSAEILSDQGEWAQAVDLFDGARRNYEAVGYAAGVAASALYAGVALTRDGRLDEAEGRFAAARTSLERLGMADLLDELDSRVLELQLLAGTVTLDSCTGLAARLGAQHPCISRVWRVEAILRHGAGDLTEAERLLGEAVRAGEGLDRVLALRALAALWPDSSAVGTWMAEAEAICRQMEARRVAPALPPRGT